MEVLLFKKLDVPTWENECMVMVGAKNERERELQLVKKTYGGF
jgi:hypothetical protein